MFLALYTKVRVLRWMVGNFISNYLCYLALAFITHVVATIKQLNPLIAVIPGFQFMIGYL